MADVTPPPQFQRFGFPHKGIAETFHTEPRKHGKTEEQPETAFQPLPQIVDLDSRLKELGKCPCSRQPRGHLFVECSAVVLRMLPSVPENLGEENYLLHLVHSNFEHKSVAEEDAKALMRVEWVRINNISNKEYCGKDLNATPFFMGAHDDDDLYVEQLEQAVNALRSKTFKCEDWHVYGNMQISDMVDCYARDIFNSPPPPSSGKATLEVPRPDDNAVLLTGPSYPFDGDNLTVISLNLKALPIHEDGTVSAQERPLQLANDHLGVNRNYVMENAFRVQELCAINGSVSVCYSILHPAIYARFGAVVNSGNWEDNCPLLVSGFISVEMFETPCSAPIYLFKADNQRVTNGSTIPLAPSSLSFKEREFFRVTVSLRGRRACEDDTQGGDDDVLLASYWAEVGAVTESYGALKEYNDILQDETDQRTLKVVDGVELLVAFTDSQNNFEGVYR